jgi:hypothetical protein
MRQLNVGAFEGIVGDSTMAPEKFTFNAINTNQVLEIHGHNNPERSFFVFETNGPVLKEGISLTPSSHAGWAQCLKYSAYI